MFTPPWLWESEEDYSSSSVACEKREQRRLARRRRRQHFRRQQSLPLSSKFIRRDTSRVWSLPSASNFKPAPREQSGMNCVFALGRNGSFCWE